MKRILKYICLFFLLYITTSLLVGHIPFLRKRSIQNQINYLTNTLHDGQDSILQTQYPEGQTFSNAIFALALIEYSNKIEPNEIYLSGTIDLCINNLLSASTKSYFHENLNPNYGAFYNGWTNFCLLKYINSSAFENSSHQEYFSACHDSINQLLLLAQKDSLNILESYKGASWPADNIVCIASLGDSNKKLQLDWTKLLIETSSIEGDLIHHYNPLPNELRGSSQALMLHFLYGVDSILTNKMKNEFNVRLVDQFLGIQFVKEYEEDGREADIDSGPIIWDYGSVATIVNIKNSAKSNPIVARTTWSFLNSLGAPINLFGNKFYIFKQEPIFDIFMLWTCVSLL